MNKTRINKSNLLQSVKGKILVMGVLGIAVAVIVGLVGVVSINRNAIWNGRHLAFSSDSS